MASPTARRLESDYAKLQRLASESGGTLRLVTASGNPPTSYVVEYVCPGYGLDDQGRPFMRNYHQVRIDLGAGYPLEPPRASMVTPAYNPHVWPHQAVCLGHWAATETLDALVLRIGALLQYDPRVLDFHSLANRDAGGWAEANLVRLPLGSVTFRAAPPRPGPRVQWL